MNSFARILLAVAAAAILAMTSWVSHASAASTTPVPTKVQVSFSPRVDENGNPVKGQWVVSATVKTADGQSVNNRPVSFYEKVDFVGAPEALIGSASTDSSGTAAVGYQPAQNGDDVLIARVVADNNYAPSQGSATLTIEGAVPPYHEEPTPLASVGGWLAVAFGVLVASTWVILLGVFFRTALGVRAYVHARKSEANAVGSFVATEPSDP